MANVFGVELVPGTVYRGRLVVHHWRSLSVGPVLAKLKAAGFNDAHYIDPRQLPADWPADQREDIDDDWTAFLEGTFAGGNVANVPASSKDYTVLGFWPVAPVAPAAPAAPGDAAAPAANAGPFAAPKLGLPADTFTPVAPTFPKYQRKAGLPWQTFAVGAGLAWFLFRKR